MRQKANVLQWKINDNQSWNINMLGYGKQAGRARKEANIAVWALLGDNPKWRATVRAAPSERRVHRDRREEGALSIKKKFKKTTRKGFGVEKTGCVEWRGKKRETGTDDYCRSPGPFRRTDRRKAHNCHWQIDLTPREHQQAKFRALFALAAFAGGTASPGPLHCLFLWGGGDLPELDLRGTCTVAADILLKRRWRIYMSLFHEIRLHRVHWCSPKLQKNGHQFNHYWKMRQCSSGTYLALMAKVSQ